MISLSTKITEVPKIGPKTKEKLNKLDIHTVKDLIYHFPTRYEDRSKIQKIAELTNELENDQKGYEKITVKAELTKIDNIYTRGRKGITKGLVQDDSGEIQLIWFNMHYLKRSLRVGETYLINGKIDTFNQKISFIVPQMERKMAINLHSGRIVPIYHQTEGVSSRWLRSRINDVLCGVKKMEAIEDFLPPKLREKYGHPNLTQAVEDIHFPKDFEALQKARKRLGYDELFLELLHVENLKKKWAQNRKVVNIKVDASKIETFITKLPFKLTKDQERVVEEVFADFKGNVPMNRLLEGDVGTGKTIIAIISALATTQSGKNVLYMAPTEILAHQHYETFQKFLEKESIQINIKCGGSAKENAGKTENKRHKPKITIGTHALLYTKEKYENVGLVIIDEQHRFGVEQREKLLNYNKDQTTPHLLTMTATPIPRTLALTIYGDLKISTLIEKPHNETKITTKVIPLKSRAKVFKWIANKQEPTFIVCPFIEESETEQFSNVKAATKEYEKLKKGVFKNRKVGLLHGRLSSKEKAKVVKNFEEREIDILVSTPVIEVGIDIPDATIIVIESAERYGLASLHQLRGRVGRGKKEGYCFIFTSEDTKTATVRLKNVEKYDSGLTLAEIDLKLRGPGEVYGVEQHGFKNFKIANLSDAKLIEQIKEDAKETFLELKNYPKLNKKLKLLC